MAQPRATARAIAPPLAPKFQLPPSPSAVGDEFEPMRAIEIEHRRRRLFDRPSRHVDRRPTAFRKQPARRRELLGDRGAIDIFGLRIGVERQQAVLPDLYDSIRGRDQADNQRPAEMIEGAWQWDVRHEWDVGGLIAAIGQIDAGRGLRGPADAEENDIGMVEVLRRLTV